MKRQVVKVSGFLLSIGSLLLVVWFATTASAQYRFQPGYQPYGQPQYQPYGQPQYSPYGQPRYQRYQQPYRPPIVQQQPAQVQTTNSSGAVTPASVLRYAIKSSQDYKTLPRLSGEFEKQKAVLLSVSDLMYQHNGVLAEIIKKSSGHGVPFIILYNDEKQLKSTVELLDSIECDLSHVSLYRLKLDTIWLRDFGPRFAETKSGAQSIDFYYNGQRPLDDKFPISWGELAKDEVSKVKWTLQGGNMQSNGKGFAFVSSRLFEDNAVSLPNSTPSADIEFEKRKLVVDAFKKRCNIDQLLILEPLRPEATKHVDMFATFIAEDTVVVAEVDEKADPQNAKILKYNVNLLKQVEVNGNPLKIERIKFPPRKGKYWSPYTNIILANNLLLMPVYDTDPPAMVKAALDVYRKLLPDYHIDTVNMTSMQRLEGALHCMSINVPQYAKLPSGIMTMAQARDAVNKTAYVSKKKKKLVSTQSTKNPPTINPDKPGPLAVKGATEPVEKMKKLADNLPTVNGAIAPPKPNSVKPDPNPTSTVGKPPIATQADQSQVAAVMTYRRNFIDSSRRFSVDAYAVGLQSGRVLLRQVGIAKEMTLPIDQLCNEDRQWLYKNETKIRANGEKVRRFVSANGM